MTYEEQAKIILKNLDKVIQVNWNLENYLVPAVVKGLKEIEKKKKR
ncbi:MAG: hypothetical protein ACTH54_08640 [Vagococcus salmoninarum]